MATGTGMWFFYGFLQENLAVFSTCASSVMAGWAVQKMKGQVSHWDHIVNYGFCRKPHPSATKWNSESILPFQPSHHHGTYYV